MFTYAISERECWIGKNKIRIQNFIHITKTVHLFESLQYDGLEIRLLALWYWRKTGLVI